MSKKKNKWKSLPSACRTSIIGMILFVVLGIGIIVYGMAAGVSSDDVKTVEAEIVSVEMTDRDMTAEQQDELLENGADENSVLYEFIVTYRCTVDEKEYTPSQRKTYDKGKNLKSGDTEKLRYMIKGSEMVLNPNTGTSYTLFGIIFIIVGALAGAAAFVLRPKHK